MNNDISLPLPTHDVISSDYLRTNLNDINDYTNEIKTCILDNFINGCSDIICVGKQCAGKKSYIKKGGDIC